MNINVGEMKAKCGEVAKASLPIEIFREGNVCVAHCPALRLASHGTTPDAAKTDPKEAVGIFFEEIERMGTLADVLLEFGWQKRIRQRQMNLPGSSPPHITACSISIPGTIPLPV